MAPDPKPPPRSLNGNLPFITVMMPAYNEEAYIRESLLSLISTGYPLDRLEVIVADGQSTDRTKEEVAKVSAQYPFVRLIDNPKRLQSAGCNLAAAQADPRSEYYIRVDAHSRWSENFLPLCIETAKKTGANLVVFVNAPIGITPFQKALAYALQHPLGVGGTPYRLGSRSGWVDHGQHGCFTEQTWKKTKGYSLSTYLRANEDVELSSRIVNHGGKIWLEKDLRMFYFTRRNIGGLFKQYFYYGVGRYFNHRRSKTPFRLRHLFPLFLLFALILGFVFLLIGRPFFLFLVTGVYLLGVFIPTVIACLRSKDLFFMYLTGIFPAMHLGWALGYFFSAAKNAIRPPRIASSLNSFGFL